MKNRFLVLCFCITTLGIAQENQSLVKHFEKFYRQMRLQGDVGGVINALTHLNVLSPSQARQDTLAFVYMNSSQYGQALNTIGFEKVDTDSNLAVQVKAVSLKNLGEPQRALEQFELLYSRSKTPFLAYEIADLKIQTGDKAGAEAIIEYGIANTTDEMKRAFYERQQPYEVPLKAAFYHLKGLLVFDVDAGNFDESITQMDEALKIAPNFNLASLSKQALETRKNEGTKSSSQN